MEGKNKKTINVNLKTAIILIAITILLVASIVCGYTYWLISKSNSKKDIVEENKVNDIQENKVNNVQDNKIGTTEPIEDEENLNNNKNEEITNYNKEEIVYNAQYPNNINKTSYKALGDDTYSVDDIIVPYIDIDSEDAKNVNAEIKKVYEDLLLKFEQFANEEETMGYVKANYESYINDNVLSIILSIEEGESYLPIYTYYTYNINLSNLELLNYTDICNKFDYNKQNVENKMKEVIASQEEIVDLDETSKTNSINKSIENYKKEQENNTLKYYIDNNKNLNIVVKLQNDEISPSEFLKIINIAKK